MPSLATRSLASLLLTASALPAAAWAQRDCTRTSVGFTPLIDMGASTYQGFDGGLYANGANLPPPAHLAAGVAIGRAIRPLDAAGLPSTDGRVVLVTIGMSNTRNESARLIPMYGSFDNRNPRVTVVNGAQGGQHAGIISNPSASYWSYVDQQLANAGLTREQVQVVWVKQAVAGPNLAFPADAQQLQGYLREIVRIIKDRYPNTRQAFLSSRIYAGYALTTLNPEPYAYQSGFSVKWLIRDQIAGDPGLAFDGPGPVEAPWLAWGAYLWGDGLTPRSDGLIWRCDDFQADGTHPSAQGSDKVANLLIRDWASEPTSRPWFVRCRADMNNDGVTDFNDFLIFLALYNADSHRADANADGVIDFNDLLEYLNAYNAEC
ncbi:MAG: hypothetical protein FJ255_05770 [Phycisphaerae bacterium]|nr:hypothetical protein [Phycisphaerae bacterium]